MNVVLPQSKPVLDSQSAHNPFPEAVAHIVGFDDAVSSFFLKRKATLCVHCRQEPT